MLIAGSGGHAMELHTVLLHDGRYNFIKFFNDVQSIGQWERNLFAHDLIQSLDEAENIFKTDNAFCIGVGGPAQRKILFDKLSKVGGNAESVISSDAFIGSSEINLGRALNIMPGAVLTTRITIGEGTLIHVHASIHHETEIGEFCELSPGCRILGKAKIGSYVSVGANAVIMPKIVIGDGAIVGAGAVVTKNVKANTTVVGVPAKSLLKKGNVKSF